LCALSRASAFAQPAPPPTSDAAIKSRLEAAARQGNKPQDLRAIAGDVLTSVRQSPKPEVQVAGCTSTATPDATCTDRLKAIATNDRSSMELRLRAAGALVLRHEDSDVPALFDRLAKDATEQDVASVLDLLAVLPAANAVPVLTRLVEVGSDSNKVEAVRVLGGFATPEVINTLERVGKSTQAGSTLWAAVIAARAKLGQTDALQTVGAAHQYLEPRDLLAAGEGLRAANDPRADPILMLTVRKSSGVDQLRAVALVKDSMQDWFTRVLASGLKSPDAAVRREALAITKSTDDSLPPGVPAFLLDPDATVRVAAAELIVAWAARQPGAGDFLVISR